MSGRVRSTPLHLSMRVLLLLSICACSLAVHFIAEGLEPGSGQPVYELAGQAEHAHSIHEHSEDHFIYSFLGVSSPVNLFLPTLLPRASRSQSLSISPQLPPPNL